MATKLHKNTLRNLQRATDLVKSEESVTPSIEMLLQVFNSVEKIYDVKSLEGEDKIVYEKVQELILLIEEKKKQARSWWEDISE